jgi:hypothetical protein
MFGSCEDFQNRFNGLLLRASLCAAKTVETVYGICGAGGHRAEATV